MGEIWMDHAWEEALAWSREQNWPELERTDINPEEVYRLHAMLELEGREDEAENEETEDPEAT